jgi:hypothetical protein
LVLGVRETSLQQLKAPRDRPLVFHTAWFKMAKEDTQPKAEQTAPVVAPEEDEPDEW